MAHCRVPPPSQLARNYPISELPDESMPIEGRIGTRGGDSMTQATSSQVRSHSFQRIDAIILLTLLFLSSVLVWRRVDESLPPAEDAAMLMRYAQHLAEGHGIVWNINEKPVDGATDFLFMVMVAALIKMGLSPESATRTLIFTAHLLNVVLVYLAGTILFRVARWAALLASFYLAVSAAALYVVTCFGAPVFALFASLAWLCAMRIMLYGSTWPWAIGFGAFSLLTGLTRPEGVLLSLLMLLAIVWMRGGRASIQPALAWLIWVVGLGGIYFLWRWDYFGHPLPNPFYKKGGGLLYLSGLINSLRNFVMFNLPVLPIWLAALVLSPQRRLLIGMMLPIVGFVGLFILLSEEMNIYGRFQYVTLPLSLMVTMAAYPLLRQQIGVVSLTGQIQPLIRLRWVALVAGAFLLYRYTALTLYSNPPLPDGRYKVAKALLPYASKGYYMAVTEAGLLPFYSRWHAIDTWGLNDAWIAQNGGITEEYLDRYKPAIIMFHARYTLLTPPQMQDRWDEMVAVLRKYAEKNGYLLAAVYTDVPYGNSAHFYYVRPDLPETAELVRRIQEVEYIYWRSGVRAVNLVKLRP